MVDEFPAPSRASPRPRSLALWLDFLERQHAVGIALGPGRVGRVWRRVGAPRPARRVITVGGTNGKGSVIAFIESAAVANGWRVGAYSSPHIHRYNERIRIEGNDASDSDIVRCFEQIEAVRGSTTLTYFEVATLAGLLLMAQATPRLDLALLEVGLGGRLDAVNIIDPDVAVVTTVAMDHQEWLGHTRAAIAGEKAGIVRPGRPLVIGERNAEPMLLTGAASMGAHIARLGHEFDWRTEGASRRFRCGSGEPVTLPGRLPLSAPCQFDNAATALAALVAVTGRDGLDSSGSLRSELAAGASSVDPIHASFDLATAAKGLADARLAGRLERISESPEIVVDVGHNPQAASMLADWLAGDGAGKVTDAVFSAFADKDIEGIVAPLASRIRHWYLAGLDGVSPRGLDAAQLAERVSAGIAAGGTVDPSQPLAGRISIHRTVTDALAAAAAHAAPDERVLAFGSFHVVDEARTSLLGGL